jgi:hypothetical protein
MSETLRWKLRAGKKKSTVIVLSKKKTTILLKWLEKDRSPKGMANAVLIRILLTSGLQAAEL